MKAKIGNLILFLLWSASVFAFEVEYSVNPTEPAAGVPFRLTFKLDVEGSSNQPVISFDKGALEIVSRDEPSVTLRTIYMNGKLETSKSYEISYELVAERPLTYKISNIIIKLDGATKRIHDIGINVLSKPKEPEDVFVELRVPKTEVYLGEGVNIDYYVYSRVQLLNQEIQQFPKLNGFIKRFRMPNQNAERVERNGRLYTRYLIYSARIFPEKTGKIEIDPIKLLIQYSTSQSISPFGGFGFGVPRARSRSFLSQKTYLNVKELPPFRESGIFSGLVGKHKFSLVGAGLNYIQNEPIEIKLEVSGEGALEKMEALKIYEHQNLEEFDTKINFEETGIAAARKVFEYTYLGRGSVKIEAQPISVFSFNPLEEKYEEHKLMLGELNVGSLKTELAVNKGQNQQSQQEDKNQIVTNMEIPTYGLVSPEFGVLGWTALNLRLIKYLFTFFLILFACLVLSSSGNKNYKEKMKLLKKMKQGKYSISDLHDFLSYIAQISGSEQKSSIEDQLEVLSLDASSKEGIRELLLSAEKTQYNLYKKGELPKMSKVVYRELQKVAGQHAKNI